MLLDLLWVLVRVVSWSALLCDPIKSWFAYPRWVAKMARNGTGGAVRYGKSNTMLRHALWQVWKYRCYWCLSPKDFTETQIDHIVPKESSSVELAEMKEAFGLADDYDLHDPRNLGPICSPCNGPNGKGARNLVKQGNVGDKLAAAEAHRGHVIDLVQSFRNSSKLGDALVRASEANLDGREARKLFLSLAPGVVQRLALLDEPRADFLTHELLEVDLHGDGYLNVGVSWDAAGRGVRSFLTDLCGCDLEETYGQAVADLLAKVSREAQDGFEAIDGPAGPTNAGPPTETFVSVDFDAAEYYRDGENVGVTVGGNFEVSLTSSLVQDSWDGSELVELQGEAVIGGRFTAEYQWDTSMPLGELGLISTEHDSAQTEIWLEP